MRQGDVIALCVADLHLSHRVPVARSSESSWYSAQARSLKQLSDLQKQYNCPILQSGDVFDKWNVPAETINFAIKHLPEMYGIYGQHDMPFHSYSEMYKSAFWTLVEFGKIKLIHPLPVELPGLCVHGFPWNESPVQLKLNPDRNKSILEVALVHKYIWMGKSGYPGAAKENHVDNLVDSLRGFDVVISGDNHIPFETTTKHGTLVYNAGGFQRRKSDEYDHRPSVGLLRSDGSIKRHYLDCSEDKFLDKVKLMEASSICPDLEGFLEELSTLNDSVINFTDAVNAAMEKAKSSDFVRKLILQAMDNSGATK